MAVFRVVVYLQDQNNREIASCVRSSRDNAIKSVRVAALGFLKDNPTCLNGQHVGKTRFKITLFRNKREVVSLCSMGLERTVLNARRVVTCMT